MYIRQLGNGDVGHQTASGIKESAPAPATSNVCFSLAQVEADTREYLEREVAKQDQANLRREFKKKHKEFQAQKMIDQEKRWAEKLEDWQRDDVTRANMIAKKIYENSQLPESVRMKQSLNPDYFQLQVSGCETQRPFNRFADFHYLQRVGHRPLAEGIYGEITEYDRIVRERSVMPISEEYVGDTELGVIDGKKVDMTAEAKAMQGMGNFWDNLWTNIQTEVTEQVPEAVVGAIIDANTPDRPAPTQQVIVPTVRPSSPTGYVNQYANQMGVPPAVLYGMMGLMGLGVLAIIYRAVSK